MKNAVTERQKQLLSVIYNLFADTGYPPSFEEMRQNLGVSSNQSVLDLIGKLTSGGFLKRGTGARSIAILPKGYQLIGRPPLAPVLGVTTARFPAEAVEITGEWHPVSKDLARFSEEVFMLRISGDSMINAGIDDGDTVLVQTKKEFISGEVVYAEIGDEGTVKRFISDDKPPYVYLKPENPKYDNILFTEEVRLKGKIMSVLKSGQWQATR